jgi:spore germination protein
MHPSRHAPARPARGSQVVRPGRRGRRILGGSLVGLAVIAVLMLPLTSASQVQPTPTEPPMPLTVFVAYWDQQRGFAEVERHADLVGTVSPWWFAPSPDGRVVEQHAGYTDVELDRVRALQADGHRVLPSVANHRDGAWDFDVVSTILADEQLLERHVEALTELVLDHGFDGLQLDYENLPAEEGTRYAELVQRTAEAFAEHDLTLAVAIHAETSPQTGGWGAGHDYALLGRAAHELHLMTYNMHHAEGEPGPSAPLWWVEEVVRYAAGKIPPNKLVLGIGLFGYDWGPDGPAVGLTLEEVEARVQAFDGDPTFDDQHQVPVFVYQDQGEQRQVWFEDRRSIAHKLALVDEHGLGGAFFWRMGGTTQQAWEAVAQGVATS